MQTSTQPQAPAAPTTPAAPAPAAAPTPAPTVSITTVGPGGAAQTITVPQTREEVRQLLLQRQELSDQLGSVTGRRNDLSEAIRSAPEGASRTGLEDRIRVLDQRILQLETDLGAVGQRLSSARAELVATTENQSSGDDGFEDGVAVGSFSTLLLVPIALFFARRRWKRRAPAKSPQVGAEASPRFERLEQGMEAIAIEIERVSEGQRFLTKLLAEQAPTGAAQRIAQPVASERE